MTIKAQSATWSKLRSSLKRLLKLTDDQIDQVILYLKANF